MSDTARRQHWEEVYSSNSTDRLGWYKPHLTTSSDWIESLCLPADAPIIDIGGGASTLVDDLANAGYSQVTVVDISDAALAAARERLGTDAGSVAWIRADVTAAKLPGNAYELWHDRAVFHFLTEPDDRQAYKDLLVSSLKPGGYVIMGAFAPEAPPRCSGLPVQRYDANNLVAELGARFELERHHKEMHVTPGGVEQMYLYCLFRRTGSNG